MEGYLIQLWNMSCQASIVIILILLARLLFDWTKVPKKFSYVLWILPFFRMICPWSLKSAFRLIPGQTQLIKDIAFPEAVRYIQNPTVSENTGNISSSSFLDIIPGIVWISGVLILCLYSIISCWTLKKKLVCRIHLKENIYLADCIDTPFVMGILRPHIYLPSCIQNHQLDYVILHEQIHIQRKDHLIKSLAFVITCLHWFNPLAWIAFLSMNKDMEMSCDEAVLRKIGADCRKEYASALLELTAGTQRSSGIWLAFGKDNVKERIVNIMRRKKPMTFAVMLACLVIAVLTVGCITAPKTDYVENASTDNGENAIADNGKNPVTDNSENAASDNSVNAASDNSENAASDNSENAASDNSENPVTDNSDATSDTGENPVIDNDDAMDSDVAKHTLLDSSLYGLEIKEDTLTSAGATVLIHNNSQQKITFSDNFHVLKLNNDDTWKDISYQSANDTSIKPVFGIEAGQTSTITLNWQNICGNLTAGTYMLTLKINVVQSSDPFSFTELGVHFVLE